VESLRALGVKVVYLTGRREAQQGIGTREALRLLGLPLDERAILIMKPAKMSTALYKLETLRKLESEGADLVAMFDNEPENLLAARAELPGLKYVLMDSQFYEVPAQPAAGLFRIRHW
jgi:hypothetical protein